MASARLHHSRERGARLNLTHRGPRDSSAYEILVPAALYEYLDYVRGGTPHKRVWKGFIIYPPNPDDGISKKALRIRRQRIPQYRPQYRWARCHMAW